jgi:hypothetical protein
MIGEFHLFTHFKERDYPASDAWAAHRAAISIEEEGVDVWRAAQTLLHCHNNDIDKVESFITWHGLAGLWSEALAAAGNTRTVSDESARDAIVVLQQRLASLQRHQVVHQLMQDAAMRTASDALSAASIAFVWLKAAAVRAELYARPGLRPSTDLDLLVLPADRNRAIAALLSVGGTRLASSDVSSHEEVVRIGSVDLDIHWHVLAPGRLREGVTEEILRDRVSNACGARPSNRHMLALALIHPAFAKHVCSRHMGLNRVADTLRMLRAWDVDAQDLRQIATAWGGFTGARASLYWLSKISNSGRLSQLNMAFNKNADSLIDTYLARQIDRNWPDAWVDRSRFVLGLTFSVWLQDSPTDAIRAMFARLLRRRERTLSVSASV